MPWTTGAVTLDGEQMDVAIRMRDGRPVRVELPKGRVRVGGTVEIDGQRYAATVIEALQDRDAAHLAALAESTGIPQIRATVPMIWEDEAKSEDWNGEPGEE